MLKRFFGAEIIRTPQSAEMFFTRKSISTALGIPEKTIACRLSRLRYSSLKGLRYDGVHKGRKFYYKYVLDAFLSLILTIPTTSSSRTERHAQVIDFICTHISNLAFDGFTTLQGFYLPIEYRRAIMAYVCNVPTYRDIVPARFDADVAYMGTMLRNRHITAELLSQPEVYITRAEVTKIKGLDLAIYLLSTYTDASLNALMDLLSISMAAGDDYTEEEKNHLVEEMTQYVV